MGGILPYTRVDPHTGEQGTDVWVMISKERGGKDKGTWDMFAGKKDRGETSREAAAREGAEESCEMFGKADQISKKMFSLNGSKSSFLLKVEDLKSKEEIHQKCSSEAYLKRKSWSKYKSAKYQEKTKVKWVKLSSLIDACVNNQGLLKENKSEIKIRPYFAKIIAKNQDYFNSKFLNKAIPSQQLVAPLSDVTIKPEMKKKENEQPLEHKIIVKEMQGVEKFLSLQKKAQQWSQIANAKIKTFSNDSLAKQIATDSRDISEAIYESLIPQNMHKSRFSVFAAFDNNEKIQGIALAKIPSKDIAVELELMAVNPESIKLIGNKPRGGTGTALVRELAKLIFNNKKTHKELITFAINSAVPFYKKLGFKEDYYNYGSANSTGQGMALNSEGIKKLITSNS